MKLMWRAALLVVVSVALGCGGNGGSHRFPWLGAWHGNFGNLTVPAEGVVSNMNVGADGSCTFDIVVQVPSGVYNGAGFGALSEDAFMSANIVYEDDSDTTLTGQLQRNNDGQLVGDLTMGADVYFFSAAFVFTEGL